MSALRRAVLIALVGAGLITGASVVALVVRGERGAVALGLYATALLVLAGATWRGGRRR